MAKQVEHPADTVDANGKVWETVGENIRNGEKRNLKHNIRSEIDEVLNLMFPIGYVFIGELPPYLASKFVWNPAEIPYGGIYYTSFNITTNSKIELQTYNTIPVLNPTELQTLNEATGLNLRKGSIRIPFLLG